MAWMNTLYQTYEANAQMAGKQVEGVPLSLRDQLDNNDNIVIIGLDAATTGRLSITYYNELKGSDFYDRLTDWGQTCCWYFTEFSPEKKSPCWPRRLGRLSSVRLERSRESLWKPATK